MSEWGRVTNRGKRDNSEPGIITALEAQNCVAEKTSAPGFPDLVVWIRDLEQYELVECKDGNAGLTPAQAKWWAEWKARGGRRPVILRSGAEAAAWVKSLRGRGGGSWSALEEQEAKTRKVAGKLPEAPP